MKKNRKAVYCYAYWCENSLRLKQEFYDTCKRIGCSFELIDVEEEDGVKFSIKYEVKNVPQVVVIENNKVVERYKGNHCCENLK